MNFTKQNLVLYESILIERTDLNYSFSFSLQVEWTIYLHCKLSQHISIKIMFDFDFFFKFPDEYIQKSSMLKLSRWVFCRLCGKINNKLIIINKQNKSFGSLNLIYLHFCWSYCFCIKIISSRWRRGIDFTFIFLFEQNFEKTCETVCHTSTE